MRKRSAETQVRYLRMALSNACTVLDLVARPEERRAFQTEEFLRGMARDVARRGREELRTPMRRSKERR